MEIAGLERGVETRERVPEVGDRTPHSSFVPRKRSSRNRMRFGPERERWDRIKTDLCEFPAHKISGLNAWIIGRIRGWKWKDLSFRPITSRAQKFGPQSFDYWAHPRVKMKFCSNEFFFSWKVDPMNWYLLSQPK